MMRQEYLSYGPCAEQTTPARERVPPFIARVATLRPGPIHEDGCREEEPRHAGRPPGWPSISGCRGPKCQGNSATLAMGIDILRVSGTAPKASPHRGFRLSGKGRPSRHRPSRSHDSSSAQHLDRVTDQPRRAEGGAHSRVRDGTGGRSIQLLARQTYGGHPGPSSSTGASRRIFRSNPAERHSRT